MYKGKERRGMRRVQCKDVIVTYKSDPTGFFARLLGKKDKTPKVMPVRNISRAGICFLCKEKLAPGRAVEMKVEFGPLKPTVEIQGSVTWCGQGEGRYPYKVGVGFVNVGEKAWEDLGKAREYVGKQDKNWQSWRLRAKDRVNKPLGSLDHFEDDAAGEKDEQQDEEEQQEQEEQGDQEGQEDQES